VSGRAYVGSRGASRRPSLGRGATG
jgi:hypothetical protein